MGCAEEKQTDVVSTAPPKTEEEVDVPQPDRFAANAWMTGVGDLKVCGCVYDVYFNMCL